MFSAVLGEGLDPRDVPHGGRGDGGTSPLPAVPCLCFAWSTTPTQPCKIALTYRHYFFAIMALKKQGQVKGESLSASFTMSLVKKLNGASAHSYRGIGNGQAEKNL